MNSKKDIQPKKSFKIFFNSNDTSSYTGTKTNANMPLVLSQAGLTDADLDKAYKMTFMLKSCMDTANTTFISSTLMYYLGILLNNGSAQKSILSTSTYGSVGILRSNNDFTYTLNKAVITNISSTTTTNKITVASVTGLIAGMIITVYGTGSIYGGADFGGLVNGQQFVISSITGFTITLLGNISLTSLTGTMTLYAPYQANYGYLDTSIADNPPTYINSLKGISNINLQLTTNSYTTFFSNNVNYTCVVYFEEV